MASLAMLPHDALIANSMHSLIRLFIVCLATSASVAGAQAQPAPVDSAPAATLSLAPLFSDHMVLQRDANVPVWGRAEAGATVRVTFGEEVKEAIADEHGNWRVLLESRPASARPSDLVVRSADESIQVTDILVGDVWIASGQSNMEWPLKATNDAEQELLLADCSSLRLVEVPRLTSEEPECSEASFEWRPCTADAAANFSAVGYYFGHRLEKDLGVPIGIISCNFGASRIEAWMSREAIQAGPSDWRESFLASDGKSLREDAGTVAPLPHQQPSRLFNGMISQLIPFGIRGAIWYQGENNAAAHRSYAESSRRMINDWRQRWGQGEFPFLYVQIAAYETGGEDWAYLREAQQDALNVPNTGMVVTTDIGSRHDVHPRNKRDVGERLALVAKKVAYQEDVICSGPMLRQVSFANGKAILSFNHLGDGLRAEGPLRGFEASANGGAYVPVSAEIEGEQVVLDLAQLEAPTRIRYNWAAFPEGNLFNAAGLPAAPFRTHDQ